MAIEFDNPLTAGTVLIREDIESQNFVPGTSGWEIRADGHAEFNDVVIRGGVSIGGTSLYYDGAPGPGKLTASISPVDGVDPFGNGYSQGFTVYDRGNLKYASMQGGIVYIGELNSGTAAPVINNAGAIQTDPSGNVRIFNAFDGTAFTSLSTLAFQNGLPNQRTGAFSPFIRVLDITGASQTDLLVSGAVSQFGATWQTPAYTAGFVGGSTAGTYQALEFRIDAENNLRLVGACHALAVATNAMMFTLPATSGFVKYRPNVAFMEPMGSDNAAGLAKNAGVMIQINANGNVNMRAPAAVAISDNFYIDATIPLGDLQ